MNGRRFVGADTGGIRDHGFGVGVLLQEPTIEGNSLRGRGFCSLLLRGGPLRFCAIWHRWRLRGVGRQSCTGALVLRKFLRRLLRFRWASLLDRQSPRSVRLIHREFFGGCENGWLRLQR